MNQEPRISRFLAFINQDYRHFLVERLPSLGLGLSDYSSLLYLYHHKDELPTGASQTHICKETGQDKGAVTRSIKKMTTKNLVSVSVDPTNISRNLVSLTSEGDKAAELIDEWIREWEARIWETVQPEDRDSLLMAVSQIFTNMRS